MKVLGYIVAGIFLFAIGIAILGLLVMWGWDGSVAEMFEQIPPIKYSQACWMVVMVTALFGLNIVSSSSK